MKTFIGFMIALMVMFLGFPYLACYIAAFSVFFLSISDDQDANEKLKDQTLNKLPKN